MTFPVPRAAFYAFFAVDGVTDSYAFAEQVLHQCGVGLAPGAAFGPQGEGYLRLCFAADVSLLERALDQMRSAAFLVAAREFAAPKIKS